MTSRTYRLFVAVDLPDSVKGELRGLCRDLPGARWVPVEQLHLTLRFVGEADERTFRALKETLGGIRGEKFDVTLKGIGHFPPGKRARVLWVGMEPVAALLDLQQRVERAVIAAGLPPEDRPFAPHITLARFREPPGGELARFQERYGAFTAPPFPVPAFYLYSSILGSAGALHRREASFPLGDG